MKPSWAAILTASIGACGAHADEGQEGGIGLGASTLRAIAAVEAGLNVPAAGADVLHARVTATAGLMGPVSSAVDWLIALDVASTMAPSSSVVRQLSGGVGVGLEATPFEADRSALSRLSLRVEARFDVGIERSAVEVAGSARRLTWREEDEADEPDEETQELEANERDQQDQQSTSAVAALAGVIGDDAEDRISPGAGRFGGGTSRDTLWHRAALQVEANYQLTSALTFTGLVEAGTRREASSAFEEDVGAELGATFELDALELEAGYTLRHGLARSRLDAARFDHGPSVSVSYEPPIDGLRLSAAYVRRWVVTDERLVGARDSWALAAELELARHVALRVSAGLRHPAGEDPVEVYGRAGLVFSL